MKLTQQGGCSLGSCSHWKLTFSKKDICKGVEDKIRFTGTWVSFHTWLIQSIYSMLAGVTSPRGFRALFCPGVSELFQLQTLPSPACNQLQHLRPNKMPPKAWPVSTKQLPLWTDTMSTFLCLSLPTQPGANLLQPEQGLP